jgi:hypothetical protein
MLGSGEVVDGWDVVKRIESMGSSGGTPKHEVLIVDCGIDDAGRRRQ